MNYDSDGCWRCSDRRISHATIPVFISKGSCLFRSSAYPDAVFKSTPAFFNSPIYAYRLTRDIPLQTRTVRTDSKRCFIWPFQSQISVMSLSCCNLRLIAIVGEIGILVLINCTAVLVRKRRISFFGEFLYLFIADCSFSRSLAWIIADGNFIILCSLIDFSIKVYNY